METLKVFLGRIVVHSLRSKLNINIDMIGLESIRLEKIQL